MYQLIRMEPPRHRELLDDSGIDLLPYLEMSREPTRDERAATVQRILFPEEVVK